VDYLAENCKFKTINFS